MRRKMGSSLTLLFPTLPVNISFDLILKKREWWLEVNPLPVAQSNCGCMALQSTWLGFLASINLFCVTIMKYLSLDNFMKERRWCSSQFKVCSYWLYFDGWDSIRIVWQHTGSIWASTLSSVSLIYQYYNLHSWDSSNDYIQV